MSSQHIVTFHTALLRQTVSESLDVESTGGYHYVVV